MEKINQINIIDQKGIKIDKFQPIQPIFSKISLPSNWNVSLVNRYYLANQRQGTSAVKTRGEVKRSTHKIRVQKGLGRARVGDLGAPQMRKGGRAHGPKKTKNYSLGINRKLKRLTLYSILKEKLESKKIIIVDKITFNDHKTKNAIKFLENLSLKEKKIAFFISSEEENKEKIISSFRNLPNLNLIESGKINSSQIMFVDFIIFTLNAFNEIEARFISFFKHKKIK